MKNIILSIALLLSFISFSQNCEELKKENDALKAKIASLTDTTKSMLVKSFDPNFKVEVSKVTGNREGQSVEVILLLSHSLAHQEVCINVGRDDCKAYDNKGNVYDTRGGEIGSNSCLNHGSTKIVNTSYACEKVPTNIPVKAKITFRKILPSTQLLKKITIKIGYRDFEGNEQYKYGEIEIDDLTIVWK